MFINAINILSKLYLVTLTLSFKSGDFNSWEIVSMTIFYDINQMKAVMF